MPIPRLSDVQPASRVSSGHKIPRNSGIGVPRSSGKEIPRPDVRVGSQTSLLGLAELTENARLALVTQAVAGAPDVDGGGEVQQSVEDGSSPP